MNHLLVVGSGLSGLFAAYAASRRGASVVLVSKGRGGLAASSGCIGVWARSTPSRALPKLRSNHPYQLCGTDSLYTARDLLLELALESEYPFVGDLSSNFRLPTALGEELPAALAPEMQAAGDLGQEAPITLGRIPAFRDFHPALAARNLHNRGIAIAGILNLPYPTDIRSRDPYAIDLARTLDTTKGVDTIARLWKPLLTDVERLGVPAVLGWKYPLQVFETLSERLQIQLFEIPTLPPSVPGLRLERMLRRASLKNGVEIIEGVTAIGRVDARSKGKVVDGVVMQTAGGPRPLSAGAVILATGGILHGGLIARANGRIQESVFDLPVVHDEDRTAWISESLFGAQPYASYGIRVDNKMRPLSLGGDLMFNNLHAVGGIIAGADRTSEGSRQGIDMATAYRAVEAALQ